MKRKKQKETLHFHRLRAASVWLSQSQFRYSEMIILKLILAKSETLYLPSPLMKLKLFFKF